MMHCFEQIRDHAVYIRPLGADSIILDVGANRGQFALQMSQRFGARFYLVEANPHLASHLRAVGQFPVFACAVAAREGTIGLNIAQNDEGSSVLTLPAASDCGCILRETVEVPARTLASIFAEIGQRRVDVLKMDIEGAEVEVLESLPKPLLQTIGQITVEFHSAEVFGFNIRAGVERVIRSLETNGFLWLDFSCGSRSNVLFINRGVHAVSRWQALCWRLWYWTAPRRLFYTLWQSLKPRQGKRKPLVPVQDENMDLAIHE
jgi:FkbM family methyltransferase